jgi:DNA polymerase-1
VVNSRIVNKIQEVEELLSKGQLIALTAPLILDQTVIIGFYNISGDQGCIEVPKEESNKLGRLLFQPTRTRIAVHGLKRIWMALEEPGISTSELDLDLVIDTKLMAYLLNPDAGKEEDDLSLSHLAHEYLNENYPHMAVEVRDKGFPNAFHDALVRDARAILRLAKALSPSMGSSLFNLYQRVELPLMLVLDSMRCVGIGVDSDRARGELQRVRQELDYVAQKITGGVPVDLSSDPEVFKFLVQKGVQFGNPFVYTAQRVSTPVLEEIAPAYPAVQDILDWRQMSQDIAFLSMASARQRVHPVWGQTRSGTSRIYARQPPVQNVSRRLRYLFVPSPGYVLIKADYSQAQLRILAHLSGDEGLIGVFNEAGDVHGETARLLGIDRDLAKRVNFGICFGISAARLAGKINSEIMKRNRLREAHEQQPLIGELKAQEYIDQFYNVTPA